jgi:type I restriction enzyme S subunit
MEFAPLKRFVDPARPITYGIVQAGEDVEGGVPYIRPVDMPSFARDLDPAGLRTTSHEIAQSYRRSAVRPFDLIVSIGPSYGKLLIASARLAGSNLTQGTARVAPADGVDVRFLQWALASAPARAHWDAAVGGATFGGLNLGPLATTPIPRLPLNRQQDVADFLDHECARISALIEEKSALVCDLAELWHARVDEMFAGLIAPRVPLHVAVDRRRPVMYGIVLPGEPVEGGVLLVKGGNVEREQLSPSYLVRVAPEIEERYARARLASGDLLVTIRGSYGAVAMVPPASAGANITQDTARVAPAAGVNARYLLHVLRSPDAQHQIASRATGAGVKGVNIFDLRRVSVPMPDGEAQRRVADELDSAYASVHDLKSEATNFARLLGDYRDALTAEAVCGRLDVSRVADSQLEDSLEALAAGQPPEILAR